MRNRYVSALVTGASSGIGRIRALDDAIEINFVGAAATLTAALPAMVSRGRGHLVAVSSLASYGPLPASAAYRAPKAGLDMLMECLRIDLTGTGVRVTNVRAGFVRTRMVATTTHPMPGLMEPDEAAERILEGLERAPAEIVFPRWLAALATLSQAEQRLYDASGVAGTLRVSIPPHFDPMWSVFAEFARRYPEVRLDVFVTDRRVDLVADGIDVALRVGEGGHGSHVGRTLTRYRHRVVAAPSLVEGVELQRPTDLRNLTCACWRTGGAPSWTLGGARLKLDPVLVTNDYEHLLQMALSGQAITEVPPFMASAPLQDGQLIEVLPDHPMPLQTIRALVVETRALSPLIRQFLDFAANAVPDALGGLADD